MPWPVDCEHGWRSEYAAVDALAMPHDDEQAAWVSKAADEYGVPVVRWLDEAAEASAAELGAAA